MEGKGWSTASRCPCRLLWITGSHSPIVPPAEKPGLTERKGGLGVPSRDRNVGAPGQDSPGVSLQPVPGDSPDREPGESPGPRGSTPLSSPRVSHPPGHQCCS